MKRHGGQSLQRRTLCMLALALVGAQPLYSMAEPPQVQATAGITSITLERNCSGCRAGSLLTLNRDGRAILALPGNARFGTAERTSTGSVTAEEFERLAQLAVSTGFFALDDAYEDPDIRDGAWVTTTILRDGHHKQVLRREDAGPPGLRLLEAGIEAAKTQIRFNP